MLWTWWGIGHMVQGRGGVDGVCLPGAWLARWGEGVKGPPL